jgi:hypothetical protein
MKILLVFGFIIIGYCFPEWLALMSRAQGIKIPWGHNLVSAIGFGLLASGFIYY